MFCCKKQTRSLCPGSMSHGGLARQRVDRVSGTTEGTSSTILSGSKGSIQERVPVERWAKGQSGPERVKPDAQKSVAGLRRVRDCSSGQILALLGSTAGEEA